MASYLDFDEVKKHLRVDFDDDDAYITDLIDMVEEVVFAEIQFDAVEDLRLEQIQGSVEGEGTVTTNATVNLVGNSSNFTDFAPGDYIKVEGESIRTIATISSDTALTVSVAFTTSLSGLTYEYRLGALLPIPLGLKHAMMLLVKHYYDNRDSAIIGVGVNKMPYGFEYLIAPYKNWTVT